LQGQAIAAAWSGEDVRFQLPVWKAKLPDIGTARTAGQPRIGAVSTRAKQNLLRHATDALRRLILHNERARIFRFRTKFYQ
jgi:hypothetical protein